MKKLYSNHTIIGNIVNRMNNLYKTFDVWYTMKSGSDIDIEHTFTLHKCGTFTVWSL